MTSIGTTFVHRCSFDLQKLTDPALYPQNVNIFYEMYLIDYNGDLIDVPVKLWNQQERQGGQYTNQGPNMNEWQLTRRFFIYDTISGISSANGFENGDVAQIVRYAKKITLKVQLDKNEPEMIYPPYLEIQYQEKKTSEILGKQGQTSTRFTHV